MACRNLGTIDFSFISLSEVCTSPSLEIFSIDEVTPSSPAIGDIIYNGAGCGVSTEVNNGWYILDSLNPQVVYVVGSGGGVIKSIETCSTPTPTPTNTTTPTNTPTPTVTPTPTGTLSTTTPFGNGVIFDYTLDIVGACETGFGSAEIIPTGGVGPYTFDWYNPELGTGPIKTNLAPGTYFVRANDSASPVNAQFFINVTISECLCVSILNVNSTTCGLDNGSLKGTSSSVFAITDYQVFTNNDILVQSQASNTGTVEFNNLSAGTYYLFGSDGGGATGRSANFIVEQSTPLSYGLYVVPDASCNGLPSGKIYVTGITGTPPFTYLWNNSSIQSSITGLTPGVYSVQVTDSLGCQLTQNALITEVEPVALGTITSTSPTCFEADGSVTITVIDGTPPFYYSASTGYSEISYLRTLTLSNLSNGNYSISVTDAGLCKILATTSIASPGGISSVNVSTTNSTCSANDGSINVGVIGGIAPYVYTLIYPGGDMNSVNSNTTTQIFSNLESGTYSIFVEDTTGCVYTTEVTLIAEDKFEISISSQPATCGLNDGVLQVSISEEAVLPLTYSIDGTNNIVDSNLYGVTFSNVNPGQHILTVVDSEGCSIFTPFTILSSVPVDFSLYSTSCGSGNEGIITAFITQGTAPFNFNWSTNVAGNPQEITVEGLSGGTYSLIVQDANGCSLSRETIIECAAKCVTFQTYSMGSEVFNILSPTKHGINQILVEGFNDLTAGNSECILISATYTAQIEIQPQNTFLNNTFYTGNSLVDVPSDNLWFTTITNLLQSIQGVTAVNINPLTNQISISANPGSSIIGQELSVKLIIVYDIICLT